MLVLPCFVIDYKNTNTYLFALTFKEGSLKIETKIVIQVATCNFLFLQKVHVSHFLNFSVAIFYLTSSSCSLTEY